VRARPLDPRRWADELLALAQTCPRASEVRVETIEMPTPAMRAAALSSFATGNGGALVVPAAKVGEAVVAIATSGYPWRVRAIDRAAQLEAAVKIELHLPELVEHLVREVPEEPALGLMADDTRPAREAIGRGVAAWTG